MSFLRVAAKRGAAPWEPKSIKKLGSVDQGWKEFAILVGHEAEIDDQTAEAAIRMLRRQFAPYVRTPGGNAQIPRRPEIYRQLVLGR